MSGAYSVNEVQMLAQKAARGGGAHAAQAAHFGRAAVYHLAAGRPAIALQEALAALPGGDIQTLPLARAPQGQGPLAQSYADAMTPPEVRAALPARLGCPADLYQQMQDLAQRTYVPSSEASRAAGAGAGLTDND